MSELYHLEVKNLRKVFDHDLFKKNQVILDNLSFGFPEGQCTALMGHNGAGKTTTIRSIFGLIRPDQGEILYKGKPIKLEDKRSIGYMPETNKLPLNLNCEEVLSHQLRVFNPQHLKPNQYKSAIEQQLREVGLWEHRKKRVGKLSKGMGRRLSWAQATIHKPELIILDEPMSGLDPLGHRLMADLINKLRADRVTIVLCTHELWSIEELCDNAHIMKQGKLVFSTLEPKHQDEINKNLPHFLAISGCSSETLQNLKLQKNLPDWGTLRTHSYRTELWFKDYSDAAKWLQACLQQGLLVVDFRKSSHLAENNLLTYFTGDHIA